MEQSFDSAKQCWKLRRSIERKERWQCKRARIAMIREAHRQYVVNQALIPALQVIKADGIKAQWRAMQAGY